MIDFTMNCRAAEFESKPKHLRLNSPLVCKTRELTKHKPSRLLQFVSKGTATLFLAFLLSGCNMAQAPAFLLFGSYFPSWLIGGALGIVLLIPLRGLLIRLGIDDALPVRLLFYTCLVLIIAMAFSYTFSPQ